MSINIWKLLLDPTCEIQVSDITMYIIKFFLVLQALKSYFNIQSNFIQICYAITCCSSLND